MKLILIILFAILLFSCKVDTATELADQNESLNQQNVIVDEEISPEKVAMTPKIQREIKSEMKSQSTVPLINVAEKSELAELLKKTQSVKNMQYQLYIEPRDYQADGRTYSLSDAVIKIKLQRPKEIRKIESYFDTVYLDIKNNVGKAYCIEEKTCLLTEFDIKYDEYYKSTPLDWIGFLSKGKVVGDEQFDNRDVKRVKVGEEYYILASEKYGIPIKIEVLDGDGVVVKQYKYKNIAVNTLKSNDFEKPVHS